MNDVTLSRFLRRQIHLRSFFLSLLAAVLLFLLLPQPQVSAANEPAVITGCALSSSTTVKVSAALSNPASVPGDRCYLFALSFAEDTIRPDNAPIQAQTKAAYMGFTFPLNQTQTTSRLYSRFVLASQNADGSYQIISNARYISNPSKAAKNTYKFPTVNSKKGLQVNSGMLTDAVELNIRHSVLNIVLTDLIATQGESQSTSSLAYQYHGRTWWFRKSAVYSYDAQLKTLKQTNAVVSAILLLGWRDDLKTLIYPDGRQKGHAYYAWNTSDAAAREQLQATLSFLATRYTASSAKYGRIVNWIVGNEVNNYKVYNYAGSKTLSQYAQIYANAFRLTYNTVTSIYSNARVYISLDHLWNYNSLSGTFASRKMLDAFAAALSRQGNIPWNLAYHPYSSPLTEPKFWENKNQQLTESLTTPVINMGNISLLSAYIRNTYGSNTRIILSEQGYTSVQNGKNVQKAQSAAILYSYYLTEADDMIDSFIMNRQVDHQVEVQQGLNLGLWTTSNGANPEWANKKKNSWNVFKYMDTNQSADYAKKSLSEIGISSWNEVVDGYSTALYSKTSIINGKLNQVKSYKKKASLASSWQPYGAVTGMKKSKKVLRVVHDSSMNRNCLWGFTQTFKKAVSFKSATTLCTTLKVSGSTDKKALVKFRIFSKNNMLECSRTISAGKNVKLAVSLKNWKYRGSITKIQIYVAPVKGNWSGNSYMEMSNTVRGK